MAKRTYGKYQGKSPTEKLTDARQALFDALLADMEREGSRWVKEWSFPHPPMNGVTGEGYGPRNTAMLMYAMRDGGFRDPRFATFKMASDKGCHIIRGSHGYPIERWKRMLVSRTDPTARLKQPKTKEEWDIALPRNRDSERRGILPAGRRQDLRPAAKPVHECRILLPNAAP